MKSNPFKGVGTALVTPFTSGGSVDHECMRALVERQIEGGVDMLVACGTTGEAVTLTSDEFEAVVATVVAAAGKRALVVAGVGSNATMKTIDTAKQAERAGVDGLLIVAPYYNKPTQEGLFQHYASLADAVSLPMIIYNVPGRTGVNITAETQLRIAAIESVVATKEASGNPGQIMQIIRDRPETFHVLSGDDNLTLPLIAAGAHGVISTISNEVPQEFSAMVHAALDGRLGDARILHYRLLELMEMNFIESNPIPVKSAMAMMGLLEEVYRLPMVPIDPGNKEKLRAVLQRLGLPHSAN